MSGINEHVAELAARIDALMERENAESRAFFHAVGPERRERQQRAESLFAERKAAQGKLAAIFAERHGWRQTQRPFSVGCLAARGMHGHGVPSYGLEMDHPCFFRKDRRAAAIVGHVYDFRDEWRDWARQNGLKLTLSKFPSWYWPARYERYASWRCRLLAP